MKTLIDGRSRLLVVVATFLFAFLLAAVVAGQAPEPVSSGEARSEVVSPAGVTTFQGEMEPPR